MRILNLILLDTHNFFSLKHVFEFHSGTIYFQGIAKMSVSFSNFQKEINLKNDAFLYSYP
jgi:hypothetical protein